jgi:hypothetical protein
MLSKTTVGGGHGSMIIFCTQGVYVLYVPNLHLLQISCAWNFSIFHLSNFPNDQVKVAVKTGVAQTHPKSKSVDQSKGARDGARRHIQV